jgi:2-polyprenyl-3-methyl-5-hydroxy-6-metoxy-1,4-benzoquinol methylase
VQGLFARYVVARLYQIPGIGHLLGSFVSLNRDSLPAVAASDPVPLPVPPPVESPTPGGPVFFPPAGVELGPVLQHLMNIQSLIDFKLSSLSAKIQQIAEESTRVNAKNARQEFRLLDLQKAAGSIQLEINSLRNSLVSGGGNAGTIFESRRGSGISSVDATEADYLNWVQGHLGYAAQRDLWVNQPIGLSYAAGEIEIASINERIIEVPYVLLSLGEIPPPAAILDIGCCESSVALSLASLGYEVTGIDVRAYPYRHANLRFERISILDYDPAPAQYDAVLCLSALEHIGLGAYGDPRIPEDPSRAVLDGIARWLRPAGLLIFTAPYGPPGVDELQRTYDSHALESLFDGWTILDRQFFRSDDTLKWCRAGPEIDQMPRQSRSRAVVLVRATNVPG